MNNRKVWFVPIAEPSKCHKSKIRFGSGFNSDANPVVCDVGLWKTYV